MSQEQGFSASDDAFELPEVVRLFPLEGAVLLPGAIMPLHIFEPRYRKMTSDALTSDKLIAIPVVEPIDPDQPGPINLSSSTIGSPANVDDQPVLPVLGPVVCVGKIIQHEALPDGRFNFLLRGLARARITQEIGPPDEEVPYRQAKITGMESPDVLEIDLTNPRQRLISLFSAPPLSVIPACQKLAEAVRGPMSTAKLADLLAFHLLGDHNTRRQLLEEPDPRSRAERVARLIESALPSITRAAQKSGLIP